MKTWIRVHREYPHDAHKAQWINPVRFEFQDGWLQVTLSETADPLRRVYIPAMAVEFIEVVESDTRPGGGLQFV